MIVFSEKNLERFIAALDAAILVVSEECPVCREANEEELQALRDLRDEIRESIIAGNQDAGTVNHHEDDPYMDPNSFEGMPDRAMHNAFKS